MAQIDHKHPTMTLYVNPDALVTHWLYGVLAEKIIEPNIVLITAKKRPAEFDRINPKGILPFMTDQEGLVLYTPTIIIEYLEERFPYPSLLPIYPIMRAKCRQVIQQILHSWYEWCQQLQATPNAEEPLRLLKHGLESFAPIFDFKPYFLSDEITLVDFCITPILLKLKALNIDIVSSLPQAHAYQNRLFERETFQKVLSKIKGEEKAK